MSILTQDDWAKCATFLTAVTCRPMPETQVAAYYLLLDDIPFEVIKIACKRAVQEQQENWLPAVGKIRRIAMEIMHGIFMMPCEAWQQVMGAYKEKSSIEGSETFWETLPEFTLKVLRAMGLRNDPISLVCIHHHETKFLKLYDAFVQRELNRRQISPGFSPLIVGDRVIPTKIEDVPTPFLANGDINEE